MFKRRTYASPAYAGKPSPIDAETFHIPIRGLPDAFEGYTIVQLSDTHLPDCALPPGELAGTLQEILQGGDIHTLIAKANAAGGPDNITAVLIHNR